MFDRAQPKSGSHPEALDTSSSRDYWNKVAATRQFEFPFRRDLLPPALDRQGLVVEFGCGYGRILDDLTKQGFQNLLGIDYAENMVTRSRDRGYRAETIHQIPTQLSSQSCSLVTMVALLGGNYHNETQRDLVVEALRILKPGGILYIGDYLLTTDERYVARYIDSLDRFDLWGVFQLSDGLVVRHHSREWIAELTSKLETICFETQEVLTMNKNTALGFHYVGRLPEAI